ncbi:ABC transporter ATP-binding protein [Ornithinimicrobium cerasi]|uniref:Iron(III) transport system ATP-binding protein n=1 Tax=Ornithinimicrobium cerasi TaxID=2248773 RepID=A0A285VUD0_9MICO|nr:ABC transporter ATP-binding protein [Ornithinimicrobium cerasi]SOC57208.1 iron(III) transport system ATP-binding protein [Ornithinimicrobium cerasi]
MRLTSLFSTESDGAPMPTATTDARSTHVPHAVEVVGVSKAFGAVTALEQVSLTLDAGEFVAVLGPSGCGKTTLLRCMAGFERIDSGRVALGGRAVALPGIHLPPHRRHVAVVPQEGALFPHLSVSENVGFGLAADGFGARAGRALRGGRPGRDGTGGTGGGGVRAGARAARIEECLEMVGLAGMGSRMPHELSGGQQQRVALARALAPHPPLVLLDEPFSALDASLRTELRADVRTALREAGATAILVTHDQGEALSMADRVAVMCDGRLRQVGTPEEVYTTPVDAWVATFVGEAELLEVTQGHGDRLDTPLGPVSVLDGGPAASHVVLRPEQVHLVPDRGDGLSADAGAGAVRTVVRSVDFHGHDALVTLELPGGRTARARTGAHPPRPGERMLAWVEGVCRAVPPGGL